MANSSSMRFDNLDALVNSNLQQNDLFSDYNDPNYTKASIDDLSSKSLNDIAIAKRYEGARAAKRLEKFMLDQRSASMAKQILAPPPFVGPTLAGSGQSSLFANYNTAQQNAYLASYGRTSIPPQFKSSDVSIGKIPIASSNNTQSDAKTVDTIAKGTEKGFKAGIASYLITSSANAFTNYLTSSAGIQRAAMGSVFGNGYNYGGAARINSMDVRQSASLAQVGLGALGSAIGLFGGAGGVMVGGALGNAAGAMLGASATSKADLQVEALSRAINLRMGIDVMKNTNPAAYKALSGGINGGFSNKGDAYIADPLNELAQSIAKGVGVYNKNFKEIDRMTVSAAAFNMSVGQAAKFGSSVGALSGMKGFNLQNLIDTAGAYGISPDLLSERTLSYIPTAGGNVGTAQDIAAKSFSQSPGYAAHVAGLASTPAIQRFINNQLFTMAGVSYADYMNPDAKGHAKAVAEVNKILSGEQYGQTIPLREALINMEGTTRATADYYDQENQKRQIESHGITMTKSQLAYRNMQQSQNIAGLNDVLDLDEVRSQFNSFNNSLGGGTHELRSFTDSIMDTANALNNLIDTISGVDPKDKSGRYVHQSGKTSSGN